MAATGSTPGERLRGIAPVCGFAGLAAGFVSAVVGGLGQRVVSVLAVVFFALCNRIHEDTSDAPTIGFVCTAIGAFGGYGFGAAVMALLDGSGIWTVRLPLFLLLVMLFHVAEFAFAVAHHPQDATFRAFLLTPVPSGGYSIAMIAALSEFWVSFALFGERSLLHAHGGGLFLFVAFVASGGGWAMRTAALFTARSNFTHLVAQQKEQSHQLVTCGVYQICRHPGYLGWFMWSVATQLVLGNVLCFVAYAAVSWMFFASRIPGEERLLVRFFGQEYIDYSRRVSCGLPWISQL